MVKFDTPGTVRYVSRPEDDADLFAGQQQLVVTSSWTTGRTTTARRTHFNQHVVGLATLADCGVLGDSVNMRSPDSRPTSANGWTMPFVVVTGTTFAATAARMAASMLSVFLRQGEDVYRTYCTTARGGTGSCSSTNILDPPRMGARKTGKIPAGWPQHPTYGRHLLHSCSDTTRAMKLHVRMRDVELRTLQGRYLPGSLSPRDRLRAYATWCNAVEGNTTFTRPSPGYGEIVGRATSMTFVRPQTAETRSPMSGASPRSATRPRLPGRDRTSRAACPRPLDSAAAVLQPRRPQRSHRFPAAPRSTGTASRYGTARSSRTRDRGNSSRGLSVSRRRMGDLRHTVLFGALR